MGNGWRWGGSLGIAVALLLGAPAARADCSPTPASCYCARAVAVVDGTVQTVGETLSIQIDALTENASTNLPIAVGGMIDVTPLYGDQAQVGQRVIFGLNENAEITDQLFVVSGSDTVSCELSGGHEAPVTDATQWMLSSLSQCHATLDAKGWMPPCNDTVNCSTSAPGGAGGALIAIAFAGLLAAGGRRRQFGSQSKRAR